MVPQTEARTAAPRAAVRDSLVVGAPLMTVLHLSVEQQSILVSRVMMPSMVELVVALHPVVAVQPWLLKPLKPVILGNAGHKKRRMMMSQYERQTCTHVLCVRPLHYQDFTVRMNA